MWLYYYFLIGHKMVMVHFYQLILNIDDVCSKLYTIFSKKPKCTLFAGSTVHVPCRQRTKHIFKISFPVNKSYSVIPLFRIPRFTVSQSTVKSLWQLTIHLRVFSCPRRLPASWKSIAKGTRQQNKTVNGLVSSDTHAVTHKPCKQHALQVQTGS